MRHNSKTYENLVVNNLEETRNFKDISLHERKIRYEKIRNKNFGIKHSKCPTKTLHVLVGQIVISINELLNLKWKSEGLLNGNVK